MRRHYGSFGVADRLDPPAKAILFQPNAVPFQTQLFRHRIRQGVVVLAQHHVARASSGVIGYLRTTTRPTSLHCMGSRKAE
jgi:hypothetical protein